MRFLIGTFGFNFLIFIAKMVGTVFHGNAGQYGLLTSALAIGSVSSALLAAKREQPSMPLARIATLGFGLFCGLGSHRTRSMAVCGRADAHRPVGADFNTSTNALMQLSTDSNMRGRVMALRIAIVRGGTPLGAPIVGWAAEHVGPPWAMGIGCVSGVAAASVCLVELLRERRQPVASRRS